MYRFSYVPGVNGRAVEVTKELFHQIINNPKVKRICAEIKEQGQRIKNQEPGTKTKEPGGKSQEAISRLKRQLPAFCWHAWFDEGKRKNYAAHPSGLIMLDLDHVGNPRELFEKIREKCLSLGLVVAHVTPSTEGLRLVFPVPKTTQKGLSPLCSFTLEEAQRYYVKALKLKNLDACTKDLARLSFCVPEEYFLYIDEEALFNANDNENENDNDRCSQMPGTETASGLKPALFAHKEFYGDHWAPYRPAKEGAGLHPCEQSSVGTPKEAGRTDPLNKALGLQENERDGDAIPEKETDPNVSGDYDGIPYPLIVESLQELMGGVPAHGSRNNFIYAMAAYLRYVCNDDPEWIAKILPTYGETADKWRRTIDSACQRAQYRQMPLIVKRAIENARVRNDNVNDNHNGNRPPEMPKRLPKLIRHLVKNVPEVCRPAVANAVFPALAAHLKDVQFKLIDGTMKEATFMCVTMAKQSSGKSAVNKPIEYIIADIVERDEINRKREQDWKDASANKGANKEKPKRPDDLCVQVLVSDMTNAAFVQRMKDAGGRYLYTNLEELDLLRQLQTNGTRDVGKIICLCFDNGKYGQERVGTQSVTARVDIRWNWNASSTIRKGVEFFKGRLSDGTLSRLNFATIVPDKSKPFRYGTYDERYAEELKPYITNLNLATGEIDCRPALMLAQQLSDRCEEEGALTDDEVLQDLTYRAVTIAYLKAMVLYIADGMEWTKEIADFMEWSLDYDLWCKSHFFGTEVRASMQREQVKTPPGRKNLLDLLPESFRKEDAREVRCQQGMEESGTQQMLYLWVSRGYVEQDQTSGLYVKTEKYLERHRQ